MRVLLPLICAALLFAGAVAVAAPATPADSQILVLPFSIAPGAPQGWIGRGMQQDLATDLGRGTIARILAPASAPAVADSAEALDAARRFGASIVVFGQVQYNGTEVRLTGQVLEVATENSLGSLKATGPLVELFHLEDAIVGQTMAALPRAMLTPEAAAAMSPQAQATTPLQPPVPVAPQAPNADTSQDGAPIVYPQTPPADDSSDYSSVPGYADTAPLFTYDDNYRCAIPTYTYACPPCTFAPYYGGFGFGGNGLGRFNHDRDRGGREIGTGTGRGEHGEGNFMGAATGFGHRGISTLGGIQSGVGRGETVRSSSSGVFRSSSRGSYSAARSSRGFSGGSRSGGGSHAGAARGGGGFHGGGGHGGGGRR